MVAVTRVFIISEPAHSGTEKQSEQCVCLCTCVCKYGQGSLELLANTADISVLFFTWGKWNKF